MRSRLVHNEYDKDKDKDKYKDKHEDKQDDKSFSPDSTPQASMWRRFILGLHKTLEVLCLKKKGKTGLTVQCIDIKELSWFVLARP